MLLDDTLKIILHLNNFSLNLKFVRIHYYFILFFLIRIFWMVKNIVIILSLIKILILYLKKTYKSKNSKDPIVTKGDHPL
jgi:hypothetical protein